MATPPSSGTVLVCLPSCTVDKRVLWGKNCDREHWEVQEVVHVPATGLPDDGPAGHTQQCTYIQVKSAGGTHAVVLSKAAWMWGAHMGTNQHSLTIGYNKIATRNDVTDSKEADDMEADGLLAADLVRLALERCKTAEESVVLITDLLSTHTVSHRDSACASSAPAGTCYVIADSKELWVLETAGELWAAKKINSGVWAFTGVLTIGGDMDKSSADLQDKAKAKGLWDPEEGSFDFAKALNKSPDDSAQQKAQRALTQLKDKGPIRAVDLFSVLRDLSVHEEGGASTMASMVSALSPADPAPSSSSPTPSIHWFTATPLPSWSMFKPMIFCDGLSIGSATLSPSHDADESAKATPTSLKREHLLWEEHGKLVRMIDTSPTNEKAEFVRSHMRQLEELCCQDVEEIVARWQEGNVGNQQKAASIFEHMIDLELNFLK